eukprot:5758795-Amphidinium_carterae.1
MKYCDSCTYIDARHVTLYMLRLVHTVTQKKDVYGELAQAQDLHTFDLSELTIKHKIDGNN